ncbi:hypothetical protein [Amnibacterium kyonggiense]|uniref:Uncharacterized protein n=1 Tax=Amnibacterium kyonggiense TaxID=595671 RepID=A0A4R7FJ40_9MICO|nr:hypothetical protein [Amnibacterium kyonggiense]TDS75942.1 hypothetical protein CLV52_3055 [Amnibacterium kyonggiense]
MTIPYFGPHQNVVFVPALLALLAATIVICLPIVFAPNLRRSPRRTPVIALVVVFAVVALVGTGWLAGIGFRTLGNERAAVRSWIAKTYDIRLDPGQVGELIDGGKPLQALPEVAARLGLDKPDDEKTLELKPTEADGDVYELWFAKKPLPTT